MFTLRAPRPFRDLALTIETLLHGKLWLQAIVGLGLGLGFGLILGPDAGLFRAEEVHVITEWIALPGELFLRLIKMVLIPLVVASIIRGLGGTTDPENLKKTGVLFFLYAISTSLLAAVLGVVIASIVHPGSFVTLPILADQVPPLAAVPMTFNFAQDLPATIVNLIPANPLASAIDGELLGIVIFSIIVGVAFAMQHNHKIEPLLTFLDGVLEVCITIVKWAMWLVP
ncbi:MAG: cation:dicarboxylase symporter family transporter, partial [Candidatus Peribacter sp.]|nr:cation:dicarboxylase symporter family transporter [Candidatus Peribacter sp.]